MAKHVWRCSNAIFTCFCSFLNSSKGFLGLSMDYLLKSLVDLKCWSILKCSVFLRLHFNSKIHHWCTSEPFLHFLTMFCGCCWMLFGLSEIACWMSDMLSIISNCQFLTCFLQDVSAAYFYCISMVVPRGWVAMIFYRTYMFLEIDVFHLLHVSIEFLRFSHDCLYTPNGVLAGLPVADLL